MPKIPDAVLCNLKCSRCRKWISCGPIRLLPSGKTLCGRCQVQKDGPKGEYRHFAFEALACYFKFPCKYFENGCPELLSFKKVLEHEKKCSYSSCCGMFFRHPIALCQPRKYLNRREVIPFEVIPDEVLQYLRCGTCAGYLSSSPVQVCRDGTSVCHRCCKQLVPNAEFIKDEDFQKLVYIMIFPCIYRYHGCAEVFKYGQESEDHEKICPYGKPRSNPHKNANRQKQISQIIKKQDSMLKNGRNSKEVIINEPIVRRQESMLKPGQKERGVIETHRGHIYATLTPNAPLFALKSQTSKQNGHDEFQLYRENLANKWGGGYQNPNSETNNFQDIRNSANPTQQQQNEFNDTASQEGSISERIDSMFEDIVVDDNPYPSVITELKIKQKHNYKLGNQSNNNNNNQSPRPNRETRDSQHQRQLTDYSVHN